MATPQQPKTRFANIARAALLTERIQSNPENRLLAKSIDAIIVLVSSGFVAWFVPYSLLPALIFFWAYFELMGRGQSPGKWLLGLQLVQTKDGSKPGLYQATLRNMPLICLCVGLLWTGWAATLLLVFGLAWIGLEIYFIVAIESGLRSGDVLGGTRVADYKDQHTRFVEQYLKRDDL